MPRRELHRGNSSSCGPFEHTTPCADIRSAARFERRAARLEASKPQDRSSASFQERRTVLSRRRQDDGRSACKLPCGSIGLDYRRRLQEHMTINFQQERLIRECGSHIACCHRDRERRPSGSSPFLSHADPANPRSKCRRSQSRRREIVELARVSCMRRLQCCRSPQLLAHR